MLLDRTNLHRSDTAQILTPDAQGLDVLLKGIETEQSIFASHSECTPLRLESSSAQMLYCQTAGSTGFAKTIRRTPGSWIRSFEVNRDCFGLGPKDVYAIFGQFGHSLALYATLEALHIGAGVAVLAGRSPREQARAVDEHGVSVIYATPTQLQLLLKGMAAQGMQRLTTLRRIFCGGGRVTPTLQSTLRTHFPKAELREFYGTAETSFVTISDEQTPAGSVGRTYPGVEIAIRPLSGSEAEIGEVLVSSPYLFEGYSGADDRDEASVSTGEIGWLDADGSLFLKGRKDRMITVADRNVFPEEIEQVLAQHAEFGLCVIVPEKDALRGHSLICYVEGAMSADQQTELHRICREHIGPHAVPRTIRFLEHIPLLAAGKPDLQALARLAEASV